MEFLKHLKNIWNNTEMENMYLQYGISKFELPQKSAGILFKNNLGLSIQGSFCHYCLPRKSLPYDQYTHMEFALCTTEGFANVKDFIDTDEYEEYFDGSVYGYVEVEKIEKLYQALKEKFGLANEKD